jgi:hypothetical protein
MVRKETDNSTNIPMEDIAQFQYRVVYPRSPNGPRSKLYRLY